MIDVSNPIIEIKFDYSKGYMQDIERCLKTLFSTPKGTVALDRDLGIDWGIVDMPIPAAKSMYTVNILQQVRKYEPRVRVEEVRFESIGMEGTLIPRVIVDYAEAA